MKRPGTKLKHPARSLLLFSAYTLLRKCVELSAKKKDVPMDNKKLERKLTRMSIIYHTIGIFYND